MRQFVKMISTGLATPLHYGVMSWMTKTADGIILNVHATPRASKSQIQGLHGDALKIRLNAPPVDGKANETLVEFLSGILGVPRRQIVLVSGQTSRQKRLAISGVTPPLATSKLTPSIMPHAQNA